MHSRERPQTLSTNAGINFTRQNIRAEERKAHAAWKRAQHGENANVDVLQCLTGENANVDVLQCLTVV